MADGESRYEAKKERRTSGEHVWTFSTGKIHSFVTRDCYQRHILHFINWAREAHEIKRLDHLDERADELATAYLTDHIAVGRSPYTIQAERAALRMFFSDRDLAAAIQLPPRRREQITRSRGPAKHDKHFQPKNWQLQIDFLKACGLRRSELRDLLVREIFKDELGQLVVYVRNGKGGRQRRAVVIPGHEQLVLSAIQDRLPDAHVFEHLAKHMDIHSYRREYAQTLYRHYAPDRELPPATGRLKRQDYNWDAALQVSRSLGHNRVDVVLRHYIR
jgi:integrase